MCPIVQVPAQLGTARPSSGSMERKRAVRGSGKALALSHFSSGGEIKINGVVISNLEGRQQCIKSCGEGPASASVGGKPRQRRQRCCSASF